MDKPLSPLRRFLSAFANSLEPIPACRIYSVGVIVWIAGMIILGLQSGGNNLPYVLLEGTDSWQMAFLWGLIAAALAALAYCIKAKKNLLGALAYTVIYASPYALFLLGVWTLDAIYYQHPATIETTNMLELIFVIFYIIGIVYMRMRATRDKDEAHIFFILPTFTVVILLLGMTTFKLFTSNDYIYRDAFRLVIRSVERSPNSTKVAGTLTLNKAGNFKFSAFNNQIIIFPEDSPQSLAIQWSNGGKEPSQEGSYDFSINLPKSREVTRQPMDPLGTAYDGPEAYFQISLQADGNNSQALLRSLPIWLNEPMMPQ